MPTSTPKTETIRAQFRRRASAAQFAMQKVLRKKPAGLPPLKTRPDTV